jgi:hypothetical protein
MKKGEQKLFDESIQQSIIKTFADVSGVPQDSVKCAITNSDMKKTMMLEATRVDSNSESTTTTLTIEDLSKSKYKFSGKVENSTRNLQFDKTIIIMNPQGIAPIVKQLLVTVRCCRKNPNLINKIRSYVNV